MIFDRLAPLIDPIAIVVLLSVVNRLAVSANDSFFGVLRPSSEESVVSRGYTGGSVSLPGLVTDRDRHGNLCVGFGDSLPDYQLVLDRDFPELSITIDSGGRDTTLIVRGPRDNTVRCADDWHDSADAVLSDTNWEAGTYEIWVGTMEPGAEWTYRLSVSPEIDRR
ncbi:Alpha-mannosidase [Geitlerinema sp. FC II]|nr:hypothetical protein [Geitlerinema sp. CS-897]PPT08524.1 Alpha-mannosidase [Geitlerinema sp. FC II]